MKQRLGIAAALLGSPELLILDEPTNGLDPSGIQEIRSLIKRMPEEQGITVLVSSHLLSEIEQMAGTVGIIREGQMVYQDTIAHLQEQAAGNLSLAVSEPEAALVTALRRGCGGELQEGRLILPRMSDARVSLLVKELVEDGHAVYRVEEHRQSLEEFFLQVVGEGNHDVACVVSGLAQNPRQRLMVPGVPRTGRPDCHAGIEFRAPL